MKLFEMMINHKVNTITTDELLRLAKQYKVNLTAKHAKTVAGIVAGKNINVFNKAERMKALKEIEAKTGLATANELEEIFKQLTANM
ncbi:DUF2624 domain-containing protein [Bacillus sp. V5-8f]|uniref:DUF2624 domain-containing protein n=1 Tax=Bacillus sp. V5-8f TaxID=2053044 RepID=UPI000C78475B|nr:DUF2624 domain-containing protein [Bacillus sp. V5-8f]PLT34684.1 DUF2624 domain-containing protein [Bacillus sp. V5-8f]